ncbi:MAG: gephyrin-like molybdotransferase Glp, partial [Actinomycetota bacterium]
MAGQRTGAAPALLPVDDVRRRILDAIQPILPISLPLTEAYGCVLAEDLKVPGDLPPFASSAMDGFAVRAADVAAAPVELPVVGRAAIGYRPEVPVGRGEAVRIATGAPIPEGADAIVPIEDCEVVGVEDAERVRILAAAALGRHVRPAGEDLRSGDPLLPAGRRLFAPELGLLAAAGIDHPLVHPRPRVVVLSTGDELVPPGHEPAFGQIHDSNAYVLYAALREAGAVPVMAGIVRDDVEQLRDVVLSLVGQADAFVSSGGVSVGERDVVKAAFFQRGNIDFYRVAMQPGKPQGFGEIEGKPYFGLPGNPVSVFVSFEVFLRPAVLRLAGRTDLFRPEVSARLDAAVDCPTDRTTFLRVQVRRVEAGGFVATPFGGRGSNLLGSVALANGLAVVPAGTGTAPAGTRVKVLLFRST